MITSTKKKDETEVEQPAAVTEPLTPEEQESAATPLITSEEQEGGDNLPVREVIVNKLSNNHGRITGKKPVKEKDNIKYRSERAIATGISAKEEAKRGNVLYMQDAVNAQIKANNGTLTAAQLEAIVGPEQYQLILLRNRLNPQRAVDSYVSGYKYDREKALSSHNAVNGRLSERDEDGNLVSDRAVATVPGTSRGISTKDGIVLRSLLADGKEGEAMQTVRYITGLDLHDADGADYESVDVAYNDIAQQAKKLSDEYNAALNNAAAAKKAAESAFKDKERRDYNAQAEQYSAQAKEIESRALPLMQQLNAISVVMKQAGATYNEETGVFDRKPAITADELLQPRSKALSEDEMNLRIQRNALARQQRWEGFGDLLAGVGDIIKGSQGAKVFPRDDRRFRELEAQDKGLVDQYYARIAEAKKQQQLYNTKMAELQAKLRGQEYTANMRFEGDKYKADSAANTANWNRYEDWAKANLHEDNANQRASDRIGAEKKPQHYTFDGVTYTVNHDKLTNANGRLTSVLQYAYNKSSKKGKAGEELNNLAKDINVLISMFEPNALGKNIDNYVTTLNTLLSNHADELKGVEYDDETTAYDKIKSILEEVSVEDDRPLAGI